MEKNDKSDIISKQRTSLKISTYHVVVAPWYWYLQNARLSTVIRLYLYHHQCIPLPGLPYMPGFRYSPWTTSHVQYHIWHSYTLQNLIARIRYRLNPSVQQNLCIQPKRILHEDFTSVILIFGIRGNLSVLLNQHQLSQQSKGFTLVVLVSY